jgi:hypothetical protein
LFLASCAAVGNAVGSLISFSFCGDALLDFCRWHMFQEVVLS